MCNGKVKFEDMKFFVEVESNSGCKLISEAYLSEKAKMMFRCACGEVFNATWANFIKDEKRRCKNECDGVLSLNNHCRRPRSMSQNKFLKEMKKLVGEEYELISKYVNITTKINLKHNYCGEVWEITPNEFLNIGRRCKKCSANERRKINEIGFKDSVFKLVEDNYKVEGEYISAKDEIGIRHIKCNRLFETTPDKFIHWASRCPHCSKKKRLSKGETRISEQLEKYNVKFIKEKRFSECRYKKPLPFDFFIHGKVLIEFDGEQHFKLSDFGGKGEKWADSRLHYANVTDTIKNQYCKENKISLLRVPYWEYANIENILESTLMHYNIIPKTDSFNYSLISEWIVDSTWNHDEYIAKCPKNQKEILKHIS